MTDKPLEALAGEVLGVLAAQPVALRALAIMLEMGEADAQRCAQVLRQMAESTQRDHDALFMAVLACLRGDRRRMN